MTTFEKLVLRWLMLIAYGVFKIHGENDAFYQLCKNTHRALEADGKLTK